MKTAVIGCGAIGGLFLGYLGEKGVNVFGVTRPYQADIFKREGLIIEGVRGAKTVRDLQVGPRLEEKVDLAIFAVKTQNLPEAVAKNLDYLSGARVLSTQNGVAADRILACYFDKNKIITGIVMFGATFFEPNRIVHNFEGELLLGNMFGEEIQGLDEIRDILRRAFSVDTAENIKGKKYLKLFVNLNNCIPACLGKSMQEVFADKEVCRVAIKLLGEAGRVVNASGIVLDNLPTYPKERVEGFIHMPLDDAAGLFSKIMTSLSKEPLYGSILQSIKRDKPSEIDFINGAVVALAKENNRAAPLNEKIVALVHRVEDSKQFLSTREFLSQFKEGL